MNKEENKFLFKEKSEIEGKGDIQASKELKELIASQKSFKKLWRENEDNKKEIERLNKEIEKLKKQNFKTSFRKIKTPEEKENHGNLFHLNRVLNNMEKGKHYTLKQLASELCMGNIDLNGALSFLETKGLIKLERPKAGGVIRC